MTCIIQRLSPDRKNDSQIGNVPIETAQPAATSPVCRGGLPCAKKTGPSPALILCSLWVFAFGGCLESSQEAPPSPIVATINQDAITLEEFNKHLDRQHLDSDTHKATPLTEELATTLLDELIERRLILQEAHRQQRSVSEAEIEQAIQLIHADYTDQDFEAFLQETGLTFSDWKEQMRKDLLIKKVLSLNIDDKITVTPEEIRSYYEQNENDFVAPDQVKASQIVVAREEEAKEIRKALMQGAAFETLAVEKSLSPDSQQGGDLGFFKKGDMPEEFDVVFSLKESAISPVVQTPYGYHVFKVVKKVPARTLQFSEVENHIYDLIFQEKRGRLYNQWITDLKSASSIKVNLSVLNPKS